MYRIKVAPELRVGAVFDAAFGLVFPFDDALVAEIEEGLEVFVGFKNHVAAVAAARSACGHVFFTSEGHFSFCSGVKNVVSYNAR